MESKDTHEYKNSFPVQALSNLSEKILSGNTTFFVGAGFSIDSEWNTAKRLIIRLLARFEAMTISLLQDGTEDKKREARNLRKALITTFRLEEKYSGYQDDYQELKQPTSDDVYLDFNPRNEKTSLPDENSAKVKLHCIIPNPKSDDLKKHQKGDKLSAELQAEKVLFEEKEACIQVLTDKYYEINEWLCNAFGSLLNVKTVERQSLAPMTQSEWENLYQSKIKLYETALLDGHDDTPLNDIEFELLLKICETSTYKAGKALFLDTMGFRNKKIMAGIPDKDCLLQCIGSFDGRLKPRHKILARLAREGLSPVLVTTNFDLLLEGGFRHEGFDIQANDCVHGTELPLHQKYQKYSVINDPIAFLSTAKDGLETSQILKVHGCTQKYRDLCQAWYDAKKDKKEKSLSALVHYLDSVVFTYREIQNWRKDAWSRDYLQTLLRTQTIVLCSYSGADQVIHDTFRNVFEEMAQRLRSRTGAKNEEDAIYIGGEYFTDDDTTEQSPGSSDNDKLDQKKNTPLYVIGEQDKFDFHAAELLRSASRIVSRGLPQLHEHENYIGIAFNAQANRHSWQTGIDDQFQWLYHTCYRQLQLKALKAELSRAIIQFTRNYPPKRIFQQIVNDFTDLIEHENQLLMNNQLTKIQFQSITHWTESFHRCLQREFYLLEVQNRTVGQNRVHALRKRTHYVPVIDSGLYTAWGVIMELALRKLTLLPGESNWLPALWQGRCQRDYITAHAGDEAAIYYINERGQHSGQCLLLELNLDTRHPRPWPLGGAHKNHQRWFINSETSSSQMHKQNNNEETKEKSEVRVRGFKHHTSPSPEHWLNWAQATPEQSHELTKLQEARKQWLINYHEEKTVNG